VICTYIYDYLCLCPKSVARAREILHIIVTHHVAIWQDGRTHINVLPVPLLPSASKSLSGGPQSDSALCARREAVSFLQLHPPRHAVCDASNKPHLGVERPVALGKCPESCHAYQISCYSCFYTRSAPPKKAHSSLPLVYTKKKALKTLVLDFFILGPVRKGILYGTDSPLWHRPYYPKHNKSNKTIYNSSSILMNYSKFVINNHQVYSIIHFLVMTNPSRNCFFQMSTSHTRHHRVRHACWFSQRKKMVGSR
jgi:hypothetical protein